MDTSIRRIGILGAGKVGIVLAQLATRAGYEVLIANSRDPESLKLTARVLVPGVQVVSKEVAAQDVDAVILALPLGKYKAIPKNIPTDTLVIDAMNYWWEVDGPRDAIMPNDVTTSEFIQNYLGTPHFVKALGHMGYHDMHDFHREKGAPDRKAIALAGDNEADAARVAELVDRLGFDPLPIGALGTGRLLEPGGPGFGANLSIDALREALK